MPGAPFKNNQPAKYSLTGKVNRVGGVLSPLLQAQMMMVVRVEEILPRPAAGLLNRMLRLAPVDVVAAPACPHPLLVLRPKTQYQISLLLCQVCVLCVCVCVRVEECYQRW